MLYVSEGAVRQTVSQAAVTAAIEAVFISLAMERAGNFPVVRQALGHADAVFGFKSGFDRDPLTLGVKAGGLWPGNRARGLANHQSTIVLFDPDSGSPLALVRGTFLTALRTAAASALSIRALARADARVLGVLGAGGQAEWQIRAALEERSFEQVLVYDHRTANAESLRKRLGELEPAVSVAPIESVVRNSDVLITVTPSREPIVRSDWVAPGTHIACMGADTVGKQELETALVERASLYGDVAEQAVVLGECQHAAAAGLIEASAIVTLGAVLNGAHPGRRSDAETTLFDSTGMGLQDLAAARLALESARAAGLATELAEDC